MGRGGETVQNSGHDLQLHDRPPPTHLHSSGLNTGFVAELDQRHHHSQSQPPDQNVEHSGHIAQTERTRLVLSEQRGGQGEPITAQRGQIHQQSVTDSFLLTTLADRLRWRQLPVLASIFKPLHNKSLLQQWASKAMFIVTEEMLEKGHFSDCKRPLPPVNLHSLLGGTHTMSLWAESLSLRSRYRSVYANASLVDELHTQLAANVSLDLAVLRRYSEVSVRTPRSLVCHMQLHAHETNKEENVSSPLGSFRSRWNGSSRSPGF